MLYPILGGLFIRPRVNFSLTYTIFYKKGRRFYILSNLTHNFSNISYSTSIKHYYFQFQTYNPSQKSTTTKNLSMPLQPSTDNKSTTFINKYQNGSGIFTELQGILVSYQLPHIQNDPHRRHFYSGFQYYCV